MVRIGHASIGTDGKAKNDIYGQGDQSHKEVCERTWYKKNWHTLIRAKDSMVAERMAKACEQGCRNDFIGYDQNKRNTLRTQALLTRFDLSKISVPCSTDCSAFMSICAEASGVSMYAQYTNGNAPTTSNMVDKFYRTGMFDILTYEGYTKSDKYVRRGDILVCNGHTVMILDNGPNQLARPILSKGSKGSWVKLMQSRLVANGYHLTIDGDMGILSVQALISFQGGNALVKDGICGEKSWEKLMR